MRRHYVVFVSPGTFVSERTATERYGELNVVPRVVEKSGMHFIHSRLLRYEDIADTRENETARWNMRVCRHPLVNGYRSMHFFDEKDAICDSGGAITARGDDAALVEYRRQRIAAWEAEVQ